MPAGRSTEGEETGKAASRGSWGGWNGQLGSEGRERTCSDFFMKRHPGRNALPETGFPAADRDFPRT